LLIYFKNTSPCLGRFCHPELAAKQGELESRSFMPLPGDSESSLNEDAESSSA